MKRSFSCLFRNLEKEVILLMGQYSTESGRPIRTSSMHFESLCDNGRRARSRVTSKGAFLSPTLSMIDVSVRLHYSVTSQADSVERLMWQSLLHSSSGKRFILAGAGLCSHKLLLEGNLGAALLQPANLQAGSSTCILQSVSVIFLVSAGALARPTPFPHWQGRRRSLSNLSAPRVKAARARDAGRIVQEGGPTERGGEARPPARTPRGARACIAEFWWKARARLWRRRLPALLLLSSAARVADRDGPRRTTCPRGGRTRAIEGAASDFRTRTRVFHAWPCGGGGFAVDLAFSWSGCPIGRAV